MGAATLAITNARAPRTQVKVASSGANFALGTITGPASYDTGGSAADWGAGFGVIGFRGNATTTAEPTAVFITSSGGYMAEWVASSKKVKVYAQKATASNGDALTEVPSTTDLHTIVWPCIIFF